MPNSNRERRRDRTRGDLALLRQQLEALTELVKGQGEKLDKVNERLAELARIEERVHSQKHTNTRLEEDIKNLWAETRAIRDHFDSRVRPLEASANTNATNVGWYDRLLWKFVVPVAVAVLAVAATLLVAKEGGGP